MGRSAREGRAVCKIAPNLLISEPHEMGWFAEEACPISILGQIVDLGVPRSSRGGCTNQINYLA